MTAVIILSVLSTLLSVALGASIYYNVKFGKIIIRMEDALEVSLDKLDASYASITEVLKIPLFYDSPQVKKVVQDIKNSRDAILYVANQIGTIDNEGDQDAEEDQEN